LTARTRSLGPFEVGPWPGPAIFAGANFLGGGGGAVHNRKILFQSGLSLNDSLPTITCESPLSDPAASIWHPKAAIPRRSRCTARGWNPAPSRSVPFIHTHLVWLLVVLLSHSVCSQEYLLYHRKYCDHLTGHILGWMGIYTHIFQTVLHFIYSSPQRIPTRARRWASPARSTSS